MKKVINLKEIMIILISVTVIMMLATNVFATGLIIDSNTTTIDNKEYENAQIVQTDNNTANNTTNNIVNNSVNNNVNKSNNSTNNTVKKYNTNNTSDLPQTGIEDYNIGILLIICVASTIFAYKKVSDYRNI